MSTPLVVASLPHALPTVDTGFQTAQVNYAAVAPILIVLAAALIGVLVEAFVPQAKRYLVQVVIMVVGLVAALASVAFAASNEGLTLGLPASGAQGELGFFALSIDGVTLFIQATLLALSLLALLILAERFGGTGADAITPMGASTPGSAIETAASRAGMMTSEVFPLAMFAVAGMLVFPAANDLLGIFIALEVLSLPLYVMTGLARRRRLLSQEAALKYFLLGAFSSAFYLFGAALLYGYAGSVQLVDIAAAATRRTSEFDGLLVPGALLVTVGLLFKVGAAPFHSWTPDVYQGAPTPITGFMAAGTKIEAFGAILRVAYTGLDTSRWQWQNAVIVIAILTMIVGSVFSVTQTDMKRLLAYSSIAHAGFILVAVLAFDRAGVSGVLFYLVAYGLSTIAAFGIVFLVRKDGQEAPHLSQWAGLGKRHPVAAGAMAFLMLAFAGVPLTSGFVAKFGVFAPALNTGGTIGTVMVVIGVLCSAITVFVYMRVIVLMFFTEPNDDSAIVVTPSSTTTFAIAIGVLATLALGVVPSALLDLANSSSLFIR